MKPVTVIILVEHGNHLSKQLDHILQQTVSPKEIWIIQQDSKVDVRKTLKEKNKKCKIRHYFLSPNFGSSCTFHLAGLAVTEFVWILADGVIPGRCWLEYAISKLLEYNCLITCTGSILKGKLEQSEPLFLSTETIDQFLEQPFSFVEEDYFVDFGLFSFVLKQEWLFHFWSFLPYSFLYGENIHLSASLKVNAGIKTLVPRQEKEELIGNLGSSSNLREVEFLTSEKFSAIRKGQLGFLLDQKGWIPVQLQEIKRGYFFLEIGPNNLSYFDAALHPKSFNFQYFDLGYLEVAYEKVDSHFFRLNAKEKLNRGDRSFFIDFSEKINRHIFVLMKGSAKPKIRNDMVVKNKNSKEIVFMADGITQQVSEDFEWIHFDFSSLLEQDEESAFLLSRIIGFYFLVNPGEKASGKLEIMAFFAGSVKKFEQILTL